MTFYEKGDIMLVACNKCKKEFEAELKERLVYFGVESVCHVYMVCPFCHKQYTISFRNSKVKYLQRMLDEARREDRRKVRFRSSIIDDLKMEIAKEVERLRAIYEKRGF